MSPFRQLSHRLGALLTRCWGYIVLGLLGIFLSFYLSLTRIFPFEMAWDMDLVTVHDALLINSSQFPLHIDHPKFGMHLLTSKALAIGHFFNLISVSDFAGLRQSPSPMLCVAELVLFLRSVEALVIWLSLLLASLLLWRLFPRQRLLHVLGLPLLGLETGLIYCSAIMRTEAYSIFFLLLGLTGFCFLFELARTRRALWPELLAWLWGGLCFGLALLTKLQAIVTAPFFLVICLYLYMRRPAPAESARDAESPRELPARLQALPALLLGLSLLAAGLLAWLAWRAPTLRGMQPSLIPLADYFSAKLSLGQLLSHLKLQLVWLALLTSAALSPLLARMPALERFRRFFSLYPLFWCALLASFWLPALTYLGQPEAASKNWRFMLQMVQSVLWTDTNASTTAGAGSFLTTLQFALITNKNYLLLALAALVIAAYQLLRPGAELQKRGFKTVLISFVIGSLILLFGSRAILRDTIWFEFLGSLSMLMLIHHAWQGLRQKPLLQSLLALCLLLTVLTNGASVAYTEKQIYLYIAPFKSARFSALVTTDFASTDMELPQILSRAYGQHLHPPENADSKYPDRDLLRRAVEQARQLDSLRQLANLPFMNLRVPVSALGLAEPGFPAWASQQGWARFKSLTPALRGSILIEPQALHPGASARWLGMNDAAPVKERWVRASGTGQLSIFPSTEMPLLICVSRSDYQRLFQILPEAAAAVQIEADGKPVDYYPIQIVGEELPILKTVSGFTEIDAKWLSSFRYPPFLLLQTGNAWLPPYPRWANMIEMADPSALHQP